MRRLFAEGALSLTDADNVMNFWEFILSIDRALLYLQSGFLDLIMQ